MYWSQMRNAVFYAVITTCFYNHCVDFNVGVEKRGTDCVSRQTLIAVVEQAWRLGYDIYAGAEFTFSVLEKDTVGNRAKDFLDLPKDAFEKLSAGLIALGARVEKVGTPGSYTVTIPLARVSEVADKLVALKILLKSFSSDKYTVTMMPFVRHGYSGNGLKMAWYLFDILEQKNMCQQEVSFRAQQSIAGILSVMRDITVFLNPTINSYKRLKCGIAAGRRSVAWSLGESPAVLNFVKDWAGNGQPALVITHADMGADPYLAYAAVSRAALEGIKYNMDAPQAVKTDDSVFGDEGSGKIHQLPASLSQAIQYAETSDFLRDWLGEMLDIYLEEKRKEVEAYEGAVTDWEFKRYA